MFQELRLFNTPPASISYSRVKKWQRNLLISNKITFDINFHRSLANWFELLTNFVLGA